MNYLHSLSLNFSPNLSKFYAAFLFCTLKINCQCATARSLLSAPSFWSSHRSHPWQNISVTARAVCSSGSCCLPVCCPLAPGMTWEQVWFEEWVWRSLEGGLGTWVSQVLCCAGDWCIYRLAGPKVSKHLPLLLPGSLPDEIFLSWPVSNIIMPFI